MIKRQNYASDEILDLCMCWFIHGYNYIPHCLIRVGATHRQLLGWPIAILCDTQYIKFMDDTFSNQQLELRRGTIVLAILGILQQPQYGYGLLKELDISGITVDAGTLYPLLRRLEKQNILASTWDTSDARPRKYYKLSDDGLVLYASLKTEWSTLQDSLNKIIERN